MAETLAKPLIRARNHPVQLIKRILPRGLFGRSLLIILVPLLVLEGVALQIFYGSHLDVVSRRLSGAIVDEIYFTIQMLRRFPGTTHEVAILRSAHQSFILDMRLERDAILPPSDRVNVLGPSDDDLAHALTERFRAPFAMDWSTDPRQVLIKLQLPEGVLHVVAPRKRLWPGTIFLFIVWIVGSAAILFVIAALFMRIQVRALRRLAVAAEDFGMGRDGPPIRPEGATEVRQAGIAFNRMQERVRRFLAQRTEMLAGVSHDLRTPLTRLKLTLAMFPDDDALRRDVADMTADVEEMERMIEGYLAFARGERAEQAEPTDLVTLLGDIVAQMNRSGATVDLRAPDSLVLRLRADAIRRAVGNLLENACRHAKTVCVDVAPTDRGVIVVVDDDGPGIPADRREKMFRPFESESDGGTGLGLTIARDIARAHGGDITLADSALGGLSARLRLPV